MSAPSPLDAYLDVEERENRQSFQRRTLRRLISYILRYRGLLACGVLLILVATMATLLEPRLFGYAIDEAIVPKRWETLKTLALVFLAVECVRVSAMIAQAYLFEMLGQRVMQELRIALFSHLQTLPVATYDRNPAGRLVTRVTNDVGALAEMFSAGFVTMFGNVLVVLGIFAWLMVLDVKLGLIAAAIFPVLIAASVHFSRKLRVAYRNARSKLSALNAFLAENLLGMRVVHLFNRQKLHLGRFAQVNQWYADAQIGSVRIFAYFQPTITWCAGIAMALVIWFGGGMAARGDIQLGVLVAYFSYVLSVFQPVREIADKWSVFLSGMAAAERIFSVLDWEAELPTERAKVPARRQEGIQGHVRFENVWFAYGAQPGAEHWVLRDFSLEIRPGMRVGIVGQTGAGKTTLISLLMRFYEPQRGRILLDGKDLREYDKRSLRAAIGIVQQDVFLFSGSIRENISLWREQTLAQREEMERSLRALGFGRWVGSASPSASEGDGAELLERGANLSMGERQVMAFARALAAEPSIWILDEATANIDSESERLLEAELARASQGRTTLLIAHRLATVRSADLIIVLHKGALMEQGNHRELMALNGIYARMYRYQSALDHPRGELRPRLAE